MSPTASDGDYLLVNPDAFTHRSPLPGDLVIARHPHDYDLIITKRVAAVSPTSVRLASDNVQEGQDSRHFGAIPLSNLCGQVTAIIR